MSDFSASGPLAQLIDDYIRWLVGWHRLVAAEPSARPSLVAGIEPPKDFDTWMTAGFTASPQEQPAFERLAALHEQLHTLARLIVMKTPDDKPFVRADDEKLLAKYQEWIQALWRVERAFAAAASDLDPLTGLRTRATLMQEIDREVSRFTRHNHSFCIVLADIDHFKHINDKHGHEAGDRVLAAVANHISRSLRGHDDAFRYGGEEFLLCLKETDLAGGVAVLERLRKGMRERPVTLANGERVAVTLSFGITVSQRGLKSEELMREADAALYRAKEKGRDRIETA